MKPESAIPPMSCDGFRARVHLRADLGAAERAGFDRHASICRACARLLIEVERLDDLLLAWQAPAPPSAAPTSPGSPSSPTSMDEKVLRALRGEGPAASCAETTASLHHFVAGDLEPWLASRVERHLARCTFCREHLDEARHSRKVWLSWRAPDPPAGFADHLVTRLDRGPVNGRRAAAGRLLSGLASPRRRSFATFCAIAALLAIGIGEIVSSRPAAPAPIAPPIENLVATGSPAASAPVHLASHRVGRFDPTNSFAPEFSVRSGDSLRAALYQGR